jgi:hypothetical protein
MSLPDVSFTNNLGTITFKRCLLGVTDSWAYDGRAVKRVKTVSVDGHIMRGGAGEDLEGVLTDPRLTARHYGEAGTLTLPWTTISNVRINGLDIPTGQWIDFVPVTATFTDDAPLDNVYFWTFFGVELYGPRLSLPLSIRPLLDEYPQMPLVPVGGWNPINPRAGAFRIRGGTKNMALGLTGSIRTPGAKLPTGLLTTLSQRCGFGATGTPPPGIYAGFPQPFNLGDAIPQIKDDMNLAHVIVGGGQLRWDVEMEMAEVSLQLLCPPQIPGRAT